jgi:hypothetical protein
MSATMLWTLLGGYFTWWLITTLLERVGGLRAEVYTAAEVERLDMHIESSHADGAGPVEPALARRSTHSLDIAGAYRIRTRTAVLYTRSVWCLALLGVAGVLLVRPGGLEVYRALFWDMDPAAMHETEVQVAAALTLSWYLFEIPISMQYHRLNVSGLVHHWLTSAAAVAVLAGAHIPYAIWYGVVLLGGAAPVALVKAFTLHYGARRPGLTRVANGWGGRSYLALLAIGLVGTGVIVVQEWRHGTAGPLAIALICLSVCGWIWDDLRLARSLRAASIRRHELVDFGLLRPSPKCDCRDGLNRLGRLVKKRATS